MATPDNTPQLRHAPATVHGRYLVQPPDNAAPTHWLIGFHGYAQSADIFLPLLTAIPRSERWLVAAVQGLHPFYTRGDRDVIAHWMTRQDRELAIPDNIAYVDTVLDRLHAEFGAPQAIVFAGFSQGVAMAYRAALRGRRAAAGLLAVGGDVPPDVRDAPAERWPQVLLATGERDEWLTPVRLQADLAIVRTRRPDAQALSFDGGHEWNAPVLSAAAGFLAQIEAAPARG